MSGKRDNVGRSRCCAGNRPASFSSLRIALPRSSVASEADEMDGSGSRWLRLMATTSKEPSVMRALGAPSSANS